MELNCEQQLIAVSVLSIYGSKLCLLWYDTEIVLLNDPVTTYRCTFKYDFKYDFGY